ncbi:MAG: hypothetical protein WC264_01230 [Candidatus Paceibacterota bacterium]|jgi:hypothetical protein
MKRNRGVVHIFLVIIGIVIVLVILGFFNSVERNWNTIIPSNLKK